MRRGISDGLAGAALAMALVVAGVVTAAAPRPTVAQEVGLPLGTQAPAASLEDLDGNAVELLDYVSGRPAVIEFWATWCENCEALQPEMDAVQEQFGDQVSVVAVAVAVSQSVRRVKRHLEQHDPGYPFLWDARGAAVRAYMAPTTSVVIILDAAGKVVYTGSGGGQELVAVVAGLLSGTRSGPAGSRTRRFLRGPAPTFPETPEDA